ncbi:hypothetical protein AWB74_08539 [Caballeronia arvi]|uniref:Uncharacterized protein n=1 Tax=Caballeronia arvi TaxID=1777135 RepID=A0A158L4U1_9BURK|nr:hypothetical protein AWB74_08539 [Caballeronia arvi]
MNVYEATSNRTGEIVKDLTSQESIDGSSRKALAPLGARLLGKHVNAISTGGALEWGSELRGRDIGYCNAQSLVAETVRPGPSKTLNDADLVLPDGSTVAWTPRPLVFGGQKCLSGPDFMLHYCTSPRNVRRQVFLYRGSSSISRYLDFVRCSTQRRGVCSCSKKDCVEHW